MLHLLWEPHTVKGIMKHTSQKMEDSLFQYVQVTRSTALLWI